MRVRHYLGFAKLEQVAVCAARPLARLDATAPARAPIARGRQRQLPAAGAAGVLPGTGLVGAPEPVAVAEELAGVPREPAAAGSEVRHPGTFSGRSLALRTGPRWATHGATGRRAGLLTAGFTGSRSRSSCTPCGGRR